MALESSNPKLNQDALDGFEAFVNCDELYDEKDTPTEEAHITFQFIGAIWPCNVFSECLQANLLKMPLQGVQGTQLVIASPAQLESPLLESELQILGVLKYLTDQLLPENITAHNRAALPLYLEAIGTVVAILPISIVGRRAFLNILCIFVHLTLLVGPIQELRPMLESVYHRMLLYPPISHRYDAVRAVTKVCS
ncbi:unnamed protein product [Dibothriocephalus latus]|uniref:Uncharacterized protein n=1 Tax=Dibothriocephalus latus TaxID=60516 RepID=A0A3P7LJ40_DIBLA|nr:unnamed protein product [Dibothriocephalus latus]